MTGSSARLARGASHQNRTVSAHCAPAAAFNAAMRWTTAAVSGFAGGVAGGCARRLAMADRKSTRLNSSHGYISYAVFCLKKKNKTRDSLQRCGEPQLS